MPFLTALCCSASKNAKSEAETTVCIFLARAGGHTTTPVKFPPKLSQLYLELRNCVKGIDSFGDRANARAYAVGQTLGQTANFRQSAPEIHVSPGFGLQRLPVECR